MGKLDGKVAIITGGGSGIGKGIAKAFVDEGCRVVIAGRNAQRLDAAAAELAQGGGTVVAVPTDVSAEDQVRALFAKTMERFAQLDIMVNSAGAFDGGLVEDVSIEGWNNVIGANVTGPFLCTKAAFPIMKAAGGGRIINIGSISAQRSRVASSPYTTSKFAVWGLTQATALEGRDYGIAVSCLHPGNTQVGRREGVEEPMLDVSVMAQTALLMATLPPEANMLEAIVLPLTQKYIGRG